MVSDDKLSVVALVFLAAGLIVGLIVAFYFSSAPSQGRAGPGAYGATARNVNDTGEKLASILMKGVEKGRVLEEEAWQLIMEDVDAKAYLENCTGRLFSLLGSAGASEAYRSVRSAMKGFVAASRRVWLNNDSVGFAVLRSAYQRYYLFLEEKSDLVSPSTEHALLEKVFRYACILNATVKNLENIEERLVQGFGEPSWSVEELREYVVEPWRRHSPRYLPASDYLVNPEATPIETFNTALYVALLSTFRCNETIAHLLVSTPPALAEREAEMFQRWLGESPYNYMLLEGLVEKIAWAASNWTTGQGSLSLLLRDCVRTGLISASVLGEKSFSDLVMAWLHAWLLYSGLGHIVLKTR